MGSNAIRLSTQMLSAIDFYAEKMGQGGDRQAVIQFLVDQYLKAPVYIDPLSEIELRYPVSNLLTVTLSDASVDALKRLAEEHDTTLSAMVRIAICKGMKELGK